MWKYKLSRMQKSSKPGDELTVVCDASPDIHGLTLSSYTVAEEDISLISEDTRASANSSEDEMEDFERTRAISRLSSSTCNSSPSDGRSQSSQCIAPPHSITRTRSVHVRTKYSAEDVSTLQRAFDENPYPEQSVLENLSQELDVPKDRIKVWFQNKRHRSRRKAFMTSFDRQTRYMSSFMPFDFGAVPMGLYPNMHGQYFTYSNLLPYSHFQFPHYPEFYPMRCDGIDNENIPKIIDDYFHF